MKTAPAELIDLYKKIGTSLSSLVESPELEEPWKSHLLEMKGKVNAALEGLSPTDQVPAAQQAAWGLDFMKSQLLIVQSIVNDMGNIIKTNRQSVATAQASITPEVNKQVEAKLKSGEYLSKADAEGLAKTAKADGDKEGFTRGKLLADRRMALATAGIPAEVIATAPEAMLLGEEAAFNTARDAAKDRVTKLTGLGLTLASKPVQTLAWDTEDNFKAQFESFELIAKAKGGTGSAQASADKKDKQTAGGIDPMAAGAAAGQTTEPAKNVVPMF